MSKTKRPKVVRGTARKVEDIIARSYGGQPTPTVVEFFARGPALDVYTADMEELRARWESDPDLREKVRELRQWNPMVKKWPEMVLAQCHTWAENKFDGDRAAPLDPTELPYSKEEYDAEVRRQGHEAWLKVQEQLRDIARSAPEGPLDYFCNVCGKVHPLPECQEAT